MATEGTAARALETLERLLELPSSELDVALTHACNQVAKALHADKVDAFLYDPRKDSLVAIGTSTQPLSDLQKRLGLDVLAVSNGGRGVHVWTTGETFLTGHLESDAEELRGVKESLGVRSQLGVPLVVGHERRGVLLIASLRPDAFSTEDARFAESVVRWVGMVAHRAQLVEEIARTSREQGRRAAAEELITVLAHDLRNVLVPISARLQIIQARAARDGRLADRQDAESATRAATRLARMISSVLDLARLDQGLFELDPRPFDLVALTREVGKLLATPGHAVEVLAPDEIILHGDVERLRQCLENVIANAIQHSPDDAPITITAGTRRRDDGEWVELVVADQGTGIPNDLLAHVFDRYATGRGKTGLGLGLYLARQIVAAHGGELIATSPRDSGARFTFWLPCRRDAS